jgi:hypothetical protein
VAGQRSYVVLFDDGNTHTLASTRLRKEVDGAGRQADSDNDDRDDDDAQSNSDGSNSDGSDEEEEIDVTTHAGRVEAAWAELALLVGTTTSEQSYTTTEGTKFEISWTFTSGSDVDNFPDLQGPAVGAGTGESKGETTGGGVGEGASCADKHAYAGVDPKLWVLNTEDVYPCGGWGDEFV